MQFLENSCRGKNEFWTYLLMTILTLVIGQVIGSIPLIVVIMKSTGGVIPPDPSSLLDFESYGVDPNLGIFLVLLPFVVSMLMFLWLVKPFNHRSVEEVINGTKSIRWNRFYTGFGIMVIVSFVLLMINYAMDPSQYEYQYDPKKFWPLVLIGVLMFPIQSSFEEILCRGYLAQGMAVLTKNRWLVMIVPAIFFALLHSANPEVAEYGFASAMSNYFLIGFIFALVSVLDDGIELAMGLHSGNNVFLALFVTFDASAIQTPALLRMKELDLSGELISTILWGVALIFILGRYYNWDFSILSKPIQLSCKEEASEQPAA